MPINKETIISVFDEKLTLMQWLKTINKALDEAVLTGVEVRQKGNATYSFVVTFEDGTELESNEFVLAQGESINGARIEDGHLYLSLTNGDELDAGNVKPVTSFAINASQHLIVYYGDGTSQDLGTLADFSNADFVAKTLSQSQYNYSRNFNMTSVTNIDVTNIYNIFGVINNVLHCIVNFSLKNNSANAITFGQGYGYIGLANLSLTQAVAEKIFDFDGKAVSDETSTSGTLIASIPCQLFKNKIMSEASDFIEARLTLVNRGSANGLSVQVSLIGGTSNRITLEPNEELFITGRLALTLING